MSLKVLWQCNAKLGDCAIEIINMNLYLQFSQVVKCFVGTTKFWKIHLEIHVQKVCVILRNRDSEEK